MTTTTTTSEQRFWLLVDKNGPIPHAKSGIKTKCWLWIGCLTDSGYGLFGVNYESIRAHRYAYELKYGKNVLRNKLCVLHKCDNKRCVRWSHLFTGTRLENTADMVKKSRQSLGVRNGASVLNDVLVRQIRRLRSRGYTQYELADTFHVSRKTIAKVITRQTWKHIKQRCKHIDLRRRKFRII